MMVETDVFLNRHHAGIQTAVLYLGTGAEPDRLQAVLRHGALATLLLTGEIPAEELKMLASSVQNTATVITVCLPGQLRRPEGSLALIVEKPENPEQLAALTALSPDFLTGSVQENGAVSAFSLWKQFRGCCERIHLTTLRQEQLPQILDWSQEEKGKDVALSVILPMYNVEKYLQQCIESVTAWKAPYVEFLFVNDGSPDHSREIVLQWAQKDSRIHLLEKENGGCASARQLGLEAARGQYVGFVDPDDFVDTQMFSRLLEAAMTGSYEISYCGYQEYYDTTGQTRIVPDVLGEPYDKGVSDVRQIHALIAFCGVAIWRGIYKMDMLRRGNIRFCTELRRFDDLPFKVETFAAARSVIAVNDYLYYYRLARPGQDTAANDQRLYVHFAIFNHLNKKVASRQDPRLTDCLQICKIQTHRYALEKLQMEFMGEYLRQARADLQTTGSFWRTFWLVWEMAGKKSAMYYLGIMCRIQWLLRLLRMK